ncbi:hypothetical protein R3W88_014819 [Solanum pinnatisectum]|uniref:DUF4283 domain-containing protein n=1 Tax=Solanum pinnatisectum TaxID=50273 RepID=A0AAV9KT60_9SOLN|nr:hypothetical protein R3W88_014819 [Solanum pinnatisectum]
MSDQEEDLLHRSIKKQKEEEIPTAPACKVSFLESLQTSIDESNVCYITQSLDNINFQDEQDNTNNHPNFIPITANDKQRLYSPWKYSLIIKLVGNCLQALWQLTEKINLIDLTEDLYLIKLSKPENCETILHQGPWFLGSQFISIRKWEPKFNPSMTQIDFSILWVRLLKLPTEFYDLKILQQIGNQIGTILKIDTVIINTTRERYVRLCILAPLSKTLPTDILIGTHLQKIQYKPYTPLCTLYGKLGHLVH